MHIIGRLDDGLDSMMETRRSRSVDPILIPVWARGPGMDIPPDLCVDPEARQKGSENDLIRFCLSRGEKIGDVVVAGRGQGVCAKHLPNRELLEERAVQRAFHNDRHLQRPWRTWTMRSGLGALPRPRQGAAEPDQVRGILGDVDAETALAERTGRELCVERRWSGSPRTGPRCGPMPG